jgi:hypothetical protein
MRRYDDRTICEILEQDSDDRTICEILEQDPKFYEDPAVRPLENGVGVLTNGFTWGHSSDGRAPALHAGGRRFDPAWLHQVVPGEKGS